MRPHGQMRSEEANTAAWEASKGALMGAAKWGAVAAVFGGVGQAFSPLYRSMTIQFKIYMQMSGMVVGSMIEADYRLRQYEAHVRMQRRIQKDRARWQRYEEEYLEPKNENEGQQKGEGGS